MEPGADLAALIADRLRSLEPPLARFDVLVVAQKIVSKAENRFLDLAVVLGEQWRRPGDARGLLRSDCVRPDGRRRLAPGDDRTTEGTCG